MPTCRPRGARAPRSPHPFRAALALLAATVAVVAAEDAPPAAAPDSPRAILLQSASFSSDGPLGADAAARLFPAELRAGDPSEGGWVIVQFTPSSSDAHRRHVLARHGAVVGPYVPRHARLARLAPGAAPALALERGLVAWIGRLHPGLRLAPGLHAARPRPARPLALRIVAAPAVAGADLERAVAGAGATWIAATSNGALVDVTSRAGLIALARTEDVLWIEPRDEPVLFNDSSRGIVQSGEIGNDAIHLEGIRGAGQIVALMDSGLDTAHCCFDAPDKVVDYRAWGGGKLGALCSGDHGTHVTGTAAC